MYLTCECVCVCAQIPDVAAVAVAAATTVVCESPDSRSSTPDELTPALARDDDGGGGGGDGRTDAAANCTTAAAGTNRSTSFGEYMLAGRAFKTFIAVMFPPSIIFFFQCTLLQQRLG